LRHAGDASEHVGKPSQRIDVIEFCRLCRASQLQNVDGSMGLEGRKGGIGA
jgi:hypothetical protein